MKVEIEMPGGRYCTGCPCSIIMPAITPGHMWFYGCALIHAQCKGDGEFEVRAIKHKKCPSLAPKES